MVTRYYEVYFVNRGDEHKFVHSFTRYKEALHYIKGLNCPRLYKIEEVLL